MANLNKGANIRIDTFGSDVTIGAGRVTVNCMIITAYTSAKTVTFIDSAGTTALVLEIPSGATGQLTPSKPITFPNGLIFDDSASELAAGDFIFMWLD